MDQIIHDDQKKNRMFLYTDKILLDFRILPHSKIFLGEQNDILTEDDNNSIPANF